MSSAVIAGAMTRPSLLAALAATTLTACAPALVEYPRARAPFAVPDVALELPAGPEVGGPQQGWVDEVLVGGDEPGVAHHGTQLEDPTADFSPDEEPTTEGQCAAVMAQSGVLLGGPTVMTTLSDWVLPPVFSTCRLTACSPSDR